MMFNTKLLSFVLQAIVVVVAVVVYSFFDPFNIFNSKKLTMKDTPAIVSSIQAIGKLITAEYYGEVIKASGEALEITIDSSKSEDRMRLKQVMQDVDDALTELKFTYDSLGKKIRNRRQLYRKFKTDYPEIINNADYDVFLTLVEKNYDLSEKKLLYYFYEDDDADLDKYLGNKKAKKFDEIITAYLNAKYANTKREQRRIANNSLVLLGRGWVKVGFDFSNFDQKHFNYLPDKNLIRLTYHNPEIISATINPWFIPERKMKGFEYLYVGKTINRNPDDEDAVSAIQELKASCLDNLINDAKDAGIMETAKEQAEVSLGQLFSLLLGKDITVKIYGDPKEAFLEDLFKDRQITARDIRSADSIVSTYHKDELSQTYSFVKTIHDTLQSWNINRVPWKGADENWEILSFYYSLADDGFCTSVEKDSVTHYVTDTTLTLKDYLYYGLHNPSLETALDKATFDLGKIPDSLKIKVQQSKNANLDSLLHYTLGLRRYLSASEIRRCDSIIGSYVSKNEIESAYRFAIATEKCMDEPEPWNNARYNWQILSLSREIQNPNYTAATAHPMVSKVTEVPRPNEYFYHLFYSGYLNTNLQAGKKLLQSVNGSALTDKDLIDRFSKLKADVQSQQKRNKESLVVYSKSLFQ